MSLTVRCPNCGARFRADADQLRVAYGWVRCGRCQQGFDAASQFSPVSADAPAARAPLLQRAAIDAAGDATADAAAFPEHDPLAQRAAQDRRKSSRRSPALPAAPLPTTPAFLREEASAAPVSSSWRSFSWLVGVVLVVLLLAQALLQHRDWLAARAPAAAPLLRHACALLGCVIAPPREIDSLVISNSSLTKIGADGYRLSLAVKNRSDLRLAMPGIELSLLDGAERIVLRRVLLARDVGAADQLEPHGEWVGAVSFDLPERSDRIAGYRVLALYP